MDSERARLREAVILAAKTFREYNRLHLSKIKEDGTQTLDFIADCMRKADANLALAKQMEAALVADPSHTEGGE